MIAIEQIATALPARCLTNEQLKSFIQVERVR